MGRVRYLIFYLLTGLVASLCHVAMNLHGPGSMIPCLGASGAISGVMGAYLALCPSRRVHVLFVRVVTVVPGYMAVGLWFLFQLINGLGLLGGGSAEHGVAYSAHIGGFVAGVVLAKLFVIGRGYTPPPTPDPAGPSRIEPRQGDRRYPGARVPWTRLSLSRRLAGVLPPRPRGGSGRATPSLSRRLAGVLPPRPRLCGGEVAALRRG